MAQNVEDLLRQLDLAKENYVKEHAESTMLSSGLNAYLQWKVMDQLELMSRQEANGEIDKTLIAEYVIEFFSAYMDSDRFDI